MIFLRSSLTRSWSVSFPSRRSFYCRGNVSTVWRLPRSIDDLPSKRREPVWNSATAAAASTVLQQLRWQLVHVVSGGQDFRCLKLLLLWKFRCGVETRLREIHAWQHQLEWVLGSRVDSSPCRKARDPGLSRTRAWTTSSIIRTAPAVKTSEARGWRQTYFPVREVLGYILIDY